jgi:hypothetical protein
MAAVSKVQHTQNTQAASQVKKAEQPRHKPQAAQAQPQPQANATEAKAKPHLGRKIDVTA